MEVDESFQEKKLNFAWLLKFYAPWCGHCRRLEPIYHQVYLGLKGSPIIVAKVDATKYPSLASAYDVRGYPTIKFIQGDKIIDYSGDRTKEDIIEFAKKAFGPSISLIKNIENFSNIEKHLSQSVFFTYISQALEIPDTDLDFLTYKQVAEKFAISTSFFLVEKKSVPEETLTLKVPTVLVWKDGQHFEFKGKMKDLESWVNTERFSVFPAVGGIGLNDMSSLDKLLVIFVHAQQSSEWHNIIREVAQTNKDALKGYQFVWLKDVEVGNSIIMSNLDTPFVFVFNASDHHYFLYPSGSLSKESLLKFLRDVDDGKYQALGGRGWTERFKRLAYDITTAMHNIYKESMWLALLIFGVPLLVISIICYTLCCIEPIDDAVYDENYDDENLGDQDEMPEQDMKKIQ